MNKNKRTRNIAGFPKAWSDYLNSKDYPPSINGMDVLLAGEDLTHNVIWISFYDFPRWLGSDVKMEIQMPYGDFKRLVEYFQKVDLKKFQEKRISADSIVKFEPTGPVLERDSE